jgi:hypothetical protein
MELVGSSACLLLLPVFYLAYTLTLKLEATRSSVTSVSATELKVVTNKRALYSGTKCGLMKHPMEDL